MAGELPAGTVTLLFTDIEASTRLLQELGREAYVRALAEHRRLLRDAVTAHAGVEVEMQGDSFHFAFAAARDAVAAAVSGQRSLAAHAWESAPIRVRMGLHTGEPTQADGLYAGLDVHRAARLMSAGHGGQVIVSRRTADLVEEELPAGVALRDLGEHRLKDLSLAQRLYDLVVEGLPHAFPPPNTLENRPTNLPAQATPLVGREREVHELDELLHLDDVRLVTVTGAGGTGKTRLALHVAAHAVDAYPDGVFFVALAPIREAVFVVPTIARTVGVREHPGEPLGDTLREHLRSRRLLVLLDNFEHLAAAAGDVAGLLAASRHLKVLVTSRHRLNLSGEHDYPVPPLSLPDRAVPADVGTIGQYESVRLFIERARAVRHDFEVTSENAPAVAEICVRLDGLPLALELAAARIGVLTPEALLRRLERRLGILTGGARDLDERQQTLRAAIEWSYDLLTADERQVFARLSAFSGGARLDAAEAVLAEMEDVSESLLDLVESLVSKSLLRRREDPDGEPRLWMLETIREYALERLDASADGPAVRRSHAAHFLELAEAGERELKGPQQDLWLERLGRDQDNLRAALQFGIEHDRELALRLVGSLWGYWDARGSGAEALRWGRAALQDPRGSPLARGRALGTVGWMEWMLGDARAADAALAEAIALYERAGARRDLAFALADRAWAHMETGDLVAARARAEEARALARREGDRWTEAYALLALGAITSGTFTATGQDREGDYQGAKELFAASEAIFLEVGDHRFARTARGNLGWLAVLERRYDDGARISLEVISDSSQSGDIYLRATTLNNVAQAELLRGRTSAGMTHLREALLLLRRSPARRLTAEALRAAAGAAARSGDPERSGVLFGAACAAMEHAGLTTSPIEERIEAELIAPVRAHHEDAFRRGVEHGSTLSVDEAIVLALELDARPADAALEPGGTAT